MAASLPPSGCAEPAPPAPAPSGVLFPAPVQVFLVLLLLSLLVVITWRGGVDAKATPTRPSATYEIRGKVDVNTATRADLLALPGVGPELADQILVHRDAHGGFDGFADLRKVPGLGPGTLEKCRPHIVLSWVRHEARGEAAIHSVMARSPSALDMSVRVDVNSASAAVLESLPGIGPKIAQRIIEQRNKERFASLLDLRRVPGIGPKTLERLKSRVTVGEGDAKRF